MHQEAQEKNITLVRKPRGVDSVFPKNFVSGAEELEMRWDARIQAWEIATRGRGLQFRIGRVVDGEMLVTLYVNDAELAGDDLSKRVARWMDRLYRRGEDLGEWEQPVSIKETDTDTPDEFTTSVPREEYDRAIRIITMMARLFGKHHPTEYDTYHSDCDALREFVAQIDGEETEIFNV